MKEFIWGVATAAYQIEGGYREDGKGDSIWDVLAHEKGKIRNGETGDVACDHYHRFREDVKLMGELGVSAYRFSIAWSRIFPEGTGKINEKGVEFYSNLIDELLKYGIEPYVTLYHWDLPQKLFEKGGWLNPDMPEWFSEYAYAVGERFGSKVKNFITINEPQCVLGGMNGSGHAPSLKYSLKDRLTASHNLLKAHGSAVKALRRTVKDVKIGFAPCGSVVCPKNNSPEEIERARKAYFTLGLREPTESVVLFSDPVMLGDYPEEYYAAFKDVLPEIKSGDMELISQPLDFYCQNIYTGDYISSNGVLTEREKFSDGFPRTALGWNVVPDALYWGAKFLSERYKKPLIITENGMANCDFVSGDGKVHDPQRIEYIRAYTSALLRAKGEGVDVRGYFYWSLMDNFEWDMGFDPRFGLVYIDYPTLRRIPKDSFYYYKSLISDSK